MILVFPQPITSEDIHKNENGEGGEEGFMQNNEEKETGWAVVANHKGKAKGAMRECRTFTEVARGIRIDEGSHNPSPKIYFKEAGPSGVDKGKKRLYNPSLSHEEYNSSVALAFMSPKKRARKLFEETQEDSEPSVEILGVITPSTLADDAPNP